MIHGIRKYFVDKRTNCNFLLRGRLELNRIILLKEWLELVQERIRFAFLFVLATVEKYYNRVGDLVRLCGVVVMKLQFEVHVLAFDRVLGRRMEVHAVREVGIRLFEAVCELDCSVLHLYFAWIVLAEEVHRHLISVILDRGIDVLSVGIGLEAGG